MFEQSIVRSASKAKRLWAASLGMTGQAVLVAGMVLAPMLWPEVLPKASLTMLLPQAPVGDHGSRKEEAARPHHGMRTFRPSPFNNGLIQPRVIPVAVAALIDTPDAPDIGGGSPIGIGVPGGTGIGDPFGIPGGTGVAPVKPPAPTPTPTPVEHPKPAPAEIQRVQVGIGVRPPRLVNRVEPQYPPIARTAGISGVVKLTGVIGVDGRIHELSAVSGNPLLVPAALGAVRQWLYEPTQLNGKPVEVITEIVVTFTLNR
jgi:protein TonB